MASLPSKGVTGDNFKKWAVDSINKLIEYLGGPFIRGGKGISVRQAGNVTIIELEKQPSVPAQKTGGGTTQDISATVSGGTAFLGLSGSTSSVEFVGTGDVTLSGNTNGQIEINVTGGTSGGGIGAPDYFHPIVDRSSVIMRTNYGPYTKVSYLIGSISSVVETVGGDDYLYGDLYVDFIKGGSSSRVYLASFNSPTSDPSASIESLVSIIIPSGTTVYLGSVTSDPDISDLAIYPSL